MGEGRKSALISEVLGQDVRSKENKAFKLEANLLKVRRKKGRDSEELERGQEA